MKRLLMLGGSPSQVPAIQKAVEMGYYVITCDYLEDNPGHKYSHEYHNVSTIDKEAVLELAKVLQIDGIVCYAADSGAPTVAYVAEKLKLASFPYRSVEIVNNKDLFRKFLEENHFSVPKAKGYSTFEEAKKEIHTFTMPVIIKPIDSSGSRGITKIDTDELLQEKVEYALGFSKEKRFIVEEFVEKTGEQVGADCFIVNGELVFCGFANNHFNANGFNPFLPISESIPCNIHAHISSKIKKEIQRLISLLNFRNGPLNIEVQVDAHENVYILDIGVRNCGDLTQVIKYSHNIDLIEFTLKAALNEDCSELKMAESNGFWCCYTLINKKSGVYKGIRWDEEFKKNHVVEIQTSPIKIDATVNGNEKVANLILKFASMDQMLLQIQQLEQFVDVLVEEKSLIV